MAKRKSKSIHTHVPTDLGVAILSIVLLLGITFFLVAYSQPATNSQTLGTTTERSTPTPAPIKGTPTPTPIKRKPTPTPTPIHCIIRPTCKAGQECPAFITYKCKPTPTPIKRRPSPTPIRTKPTVTPIRVAPTMTPAP